MAWRKGVGSTMDYFDKHLKEGDYYLEDKSNTYAVWLGEGAKRLGLEGTVERDVFEKLTNNINPQTGEKLTSRQNKEGNRRTWLDIAISPPKDLSVIMALADDSTKSEIRKLHLEASYKASKQLEKFLGTRIREKGLDESKIGNCEGIVAAVLHETARPVNGVPDPHLHTHLLFANAVFDKDRNGWFALQNSGILEAQKFVRQYYYNELVIGLKELGIQTETRPSQNDFVIAGLDRNLVDAFSRRHEQVEKETNEKIARGMISRKEAASLAVTVTREKKQKLSDSELLSEWHSIAGEQGLQNVKAVLNNEFGVNENFTHSSFEEGVEFAKEHAFSNLSVVPDHEVARIILQTSRGNVNLEQIQVALQDPKFFITDNKGNVTTEKILHEEIGLIRSVNFGNKQHGRLMKDGYVIPKTFLTDEGKEFTLTDEQYKTIKGVLENKNFVMGINGTAGAGKTTLLKQIEKGSNRKIVPLAPSGQATGILRDEGFKKAETLQQWLVNESLRKTTKGAYIIVDEAGMISTPQMRQIFRLASENDNRVLLVGDTKQIQSVERGDAFRILQKFSKLETLHIEESYRQNKNLDYKKAVTMLRHAFAKKEWNSFWEIIDNNLKCIIEAKTQEPHLRDLEIQNEVCSTFLKNPETLIVASKWETIHKCNESIRNELKKKGEIVGGDFRTVLEPIQTDQAQQRRTETYNKGDFLQLIRNSSFGRKNELFEITETKRGSITIRSKMTGEEKSFSPKKSGSEFTLHKSRNIDIGIGDTLLIKQNLSSTSPLKNGVRVQVKQMYEDGSLSVAINGKKSIEEHVIPSDFRHYLHGYAVTAHASQGTTVEDVAVLADGMKKELFYVAATRGKNSLRIYTTDRFTMENQVKILGQRKSSIEVFPTAQRTAEQCFKSRIQRHFKIFRKRVSKKVKRAISKTRTNANRQQLINNYYEQTHQRQAQIHRH